MTFKFKDQYSFESRANEATRVLLKYPDRVPIICEKTQQKDLPDIDRNKYLAPMKLTIGEFTHVIRQRIKLKPEEALFLFINNKLLPCSTLMGQIYENERETDGFLYIKYSKENVFG